jgi:hypothetical protein
VRRSCVITSSKRSQDFDGNGEYVTGAALGLDQLRLARIDFELAAQAQNLNVDAAVEYFLMVNAAGGQQLLSAQHLLG